MPYSQTTGSPAPLPPAHRRRAQNPSHIQTTLRGAAGADGIRPLSFPRKRESRSRTCVSLVPVGAVSCGRPDPKGPTRLAPDEIRVSDPRHSSSTPKGLNPNSRVASAPGTRSPHPLFKPQRGDRNRPIIHLRHSESVTNCNRLELEEKTGKRVVSPEITSPKNPSKN
jgi:hypothetical protein